MFALITALLLAAVRAFFGLWARRSGGTAGSSPWALP